MRSTKPFVRGERTFVVRCWMEAQDDRIDLMRVRIDPAAPLRRRIALAFPRATQSNQLLRPQASLNRMRRCHPPTRRPPMTIVSRPHRSTCARQRAFASVDRSSRPPSWGDCPSRYPAGAVDGVESDQIRSRSNPSSARPGADAARTSPRRRNPRSATAMGQAGGAVASMARCDEAPSQGSCHGPQSATVMEGASFPLAVHPGHRRRSPSPREMRFVRPVRQDRAECVHVGSLVDWFAGRVLGRHVGRRAQQRACSGLIEAGGAVRASRRASVDASAIASSSGLPATSFIAWNSNRPSR